MPHVSIGQSEELGFLWIELTNQCNLQCSHCYAESGPTADTATLKCADYERVIAEARQLGCQSIQFIGGEPTLNKDLGHLVAFSFERGFEFIEVFTNLTHLSPDLLDCFVQCGVQVATSVYAPESAIHDDVTGTRGSFEKTVRNIRELIDHQIPVRVGFIEMPQNAGLFEKTRDWLGQIGVLHVGSDHMRHFGRGAHCDKSELGELCGSCGKDTLCIGPDGKVSPCIMSKSWSVGSIRDDTLTDIVHSAALADIRSDIRIATGQHHPDAIQSICQPKVCDPYDHCQPKWGGGPCEPTGCNPCYPKGIRRSVSRT